METDSDGSKVLTNQTLVFDEEGLRFIADVPPLNIDKKIPQNLNDKLKSEVVSKVLSHFGKGK